MTGNSSAAISFSLAANFSPAPRTGTIAAGGGAFTIHQAGATGCIFVLSPQSFTASRDGDAGTVSVTTQAGCIWAATSNAPWLTITAGATGTGSGTFSFSVAPQTAPTGRSGIITVAGAGFTVTQPPQPPPDDPNCRMRVCP